MGAEIIDVALEGWKRIGLLKYYDLTKLSILVLEKHLLIRNLLTEVFNEFGVATVFSTPVPEIAFDIFMTNPVDIVICDWTSDLDGMSFLKRLRLDPESHNPFIPLIVCTANTKKSHVSTARDSGMTNFLTKPVEAKTIYLGICAVIEDHRPFIRTGSFFGPQRRCKQIEPYTGVERRISLRN